jgi:hypothetical protein
MTELIRQKFSHADLRAILEATTEPSIVEPNVSGDRA